jgi:integrase
MFDIAIDSKLRGCDIVKLRIGDVIVGGQLRQRSMVIQQKTGTPVPFEIGETARESLRLWLGARGGGRPEDFLFPSRVDRADHISTRQYARLVDEWVAAIGLDPALFGTHSLRRTKASLIYKRTGKLRAVQILLGHRKIESTVRYLGVNLEDALCLSEGTDI